MLYLPMHDFVERSYFKNFGNTIESDQNNNISLKVIYFLDYLDFKKWKKKKKDCIETLSSGKAKFYCNLLKTVKDFSPGASILLI